MISLEHKSFYWKEFDDDNKPIEPKECQIIFNPKDGGKLLFFLDVNERLINNDAKDKQIEILYGQANHRENFTLYNLKFEGAKAHMTADLELIEVEYFIEYIYYGGWVDINKKLDIFHVRYSYLELFDEIIYLLFKQNNYTQEQKMYHIDFLLRYEDIKENFVRILNNWIENHNKNKNEYSTFCNVVAEKNSKFNIYTHYFQLISALEGYHRRKYSNKITLKQRISGLIEQTGIKQLLTLEEDTHTLIIKFIIEIRNNIAHLNDKNAMCEKINSSFEYIKIVALLIMMKDISINQDNISKHILDFNLKSIHENLINAFSEKKSISK